MSKRVCEHNPQSRYVSLVKAGLVRAHLPLVPSKELARFVCSGQAGLVIFMIVCFI